MSLWPALKISMLLTGSELIDGRLQDTNSLFFARFLFERGQRLSRVLVCDDNHDDIVGSLKFLAEQSDIIVTSGGLGPTTGDKTREAISDFLGVKLRLDKESLEKIKSFFKERNRVYEANNDKQALIPETGTVLQNDYGTAACFSAPFLKADKTQGLICALPGVPRELEKIIPEKVIPAIVSHFALGSLQETSPILYPFRIFGLGESSIGARIEESQPQAGIDVSYRATFPEVQVLFRSKDKSIGEQEIKRAAQNAICKIGRDFIFTEGENLSLIEVIHNLLIKNSKTISLAESCTGGMLGSLLTANAGSSDYFLGSVVSYSNDIKQDLLGVSKDLIDSYGAVSSQVACAMAKEVREKTSASISVSITGIAGPDGGSPEKPVGTCFIGLSDSQGTLSCRILFPGSRKRVRQYACHAALDLIRRRLLGLDIGLPVFLDYTSL